MCGIFGIVNNSNLSASNLVNATKIIDYRGPDDEGYLTWSKGENPKLWSGYETADSTLKAHDLPLLDSEACFEVGFGHRRLSIIDLSPAGHQPMIFEDAGLAISFNGEIYNYIEVRNELINLGHQFYTASDTEVILHAWQQWREDCMQHFNGMFAFLILDWKNQQLFAIRDRFGVKPLYYSITSTYVAFASEIKQLRVLPGYKFDLNNAVAYDYLRYGFVDHSTDTFENGIQQIAPGSYLQIDLCTPKIAKNRWYVLEPLEQFLNEPQAIEHYLFLLKDSVRLRLRSDVPIGTALSGGLDSSTIVCLIKSLFEEQRSSSVIKTITSCNKDPKFDEWDYAQTIVDKVDAEPYRVFPSLDKLQDDFDKLLWHMDYPFGSTSQFSQWCVFECASKAGLTVMLDGQGADEQLAGYGSNDIALYNGLLRKRKYRSLLKEVNGYLKMNGNLPKGFLLAAFQKNLPDPLVNLFPSSYRPLKAHKPVWLREDLMSEHQSTEFDLSSHLKWQIQKNPLPSLLRYEDRNSMAFSIESRTPFMDYRLIEFTLGLDERMVYNKGTRKYILRKSLREIVPDKILDRKDKMGFVSAEEKWLKEDGTVWFDKMIDGAIQSLPHFLDPALTKTHVSNIQLSLKEFNFDPWRILCLGHWLKSCS